jgi:hypothetical protein
MSERMSQSQSPSVDPSRAVRYRSSLLWNPSFVRLFLARCIARPIINKVTITQKKARMIIVVGKEIKTAP